MAVTRSTASQRALRDLPPDSNGSRALESYLLLAASLLVAVGFVLAYLARTAPERTTRGRPILNVNRLQSAEDLLPPLSVFSDLEDRLFAARHIHQYARSRDLQAIGELLSIRVTAEQIRKARGLDEFPSRLRDLAKSGSKATTLPLVTPAEMRQLRETLVVRDEPQFRRIAILYALLFFSAFCAVHLAWRYVGFTGDRLLLPLVLVLSGIGGALIISLRDPLRDRPLFSDFVLGFAAGCVLLFVFSRPDYERPPPRRLAYVSLAASFVLSLALLIFGSGPGRSDAKVNLVIGPVSIQPVEPIKLLLVFFLAA